MELSELIDRFSSYLFSLRGYSQNTILAYKNDLAKFYRFLTKRKIPLEKVQLKTLDDFMIELKNKEYNETTRRRIGSAIRSFYKFLVLMEGFKSNPAELLELPRKKKHLPQVLSREEVNSLLDLPDLSNPMEVRDKALLELLYATGLRVSELLALRLGDIDFTQDILHAFGKGGKERIVPFGKLAKDALRLYLEKVRPSLAKKGGEFLFLNRRGTRLGRVGFWKILKKYAKKIHLETKIHPHILRHSFASHMLQGGCDLRILQELLGHASVLTTQIYTHLDIGHLKSIHQKYHPRP